MLIAVVLIKKKRAVLEMNCNNRTVVSRKKINEIFAVLLFFFTNVLGKQFKVQIHASENIFELTHDLTFRPINTQPVLPLERNMSFIFSFSLLSHSLLPSFVSVYEHQVSQRNSF